MAQEPKSLDELKQEYIDLRFGQFMCLGIATYHEIEWATGEEPADSFNPKNLDAEKWAEASASAGMEYAMFTTQHVAGFSLWDTSVSDYDVASGPYGKDIVKQYVDAYRAKDMKIGLYYCIWNRHHGIEKDNVTPEKVEHVKTQLTELLSNYGKIDLLWLDGYQHEKRGRSHFPTTTEVPYDEIYALVKKLQPECLVMRHPGLGIYDAEYTDVQIWEGIFNHEPTRNIWEQFQKDHPERVQEICEVLQSGWFWKEGMDKKPLLLTPEAVIDRIKLCRAHNSNYLLNVAINRDGEFDENVVNCLKDIGKLLREYDEGQSKKD